MNSKTALSLILSASSAFAMYDVYPQCGPSTTTVTVTVEVTPDFCTGVAPVLSSTSTPCETETVVPTIEPTSTPCETVAPTIEPTSTPCETVAPTETDVLPVASETPDETDPNIANGSPVTKLSAIVMGSLLLLI